MIDDKKIEKTARQISEKVVDAKGFDNSKPTHLAFSEGHVAGFKEGAKWAISELLKDLWHPASEEPRKGAKFLYQNQYNSKFYYYIDKIDEILETYPNWSSYVKHIRVIQWLYVDDLFPKEGGGEQ